ncbi:MAG: serine hydrolase [Bacteroidales bacterium]|nr:serine hydrolase [Bacteroidales bacterium]
MRWVLLFLLLIPYSYINSQSCRDIECVRWVDSVFNSLTLEQKVAQCLMPAIYPKDSVQVAEMMRLIKKYNPGGIIIFQGGPIQVALLVNKMQQSAQTPLLIGIDGEWGVAMRLDSVIAFPRQLTLGASNNDSLIYLMGSAIAAQLKRLGIHTNFAPVVDINSNPLNPVIGSRSWGSNRDRVAQQALVYMKALQDNKILSVAKHFPGHGDTETDSHYALPVLQHSQQRIDTFELFPFKRLIEQGLMGIMTAHVNVRSFDSNRIPASLSSRVTDSLLRQVLKFNGLIFTDALNMKGVQNGSAKAIAIKAFQAGNDILLMPNNIPEVIDTFCKAIRAGVVSESILNQRCKRMLSAKYWLGINRFRLVDTTNLLSDLNKPVYHLLKRKIYETSNTLLTNNNSLIPLKRLDTLKIAIVAFGDSTSNNVFAKTAGLYAPCSLFTLNKNASDSDFYQIYRQLPKFNLIITLLLNTDMRLSRKYGVTEQQINYIELIAFNAPTILCVFGSPYILNFFPTLAAFQSILLAYEDNPVAYDIAAQSIFGGIPISGQLPVSGAGKFPYQQGIKIPEAIRIKYTIPEELNLDSYNFRKSIDSVVNFAIRSKAMPGCVIYMAKDNKVFFHKAYGYFSYDSIQPVQTTDIFDLASITKIVATTPAIMKLYDANDIKLDAHISKYLPALRKSNKSKLEISDLLLHQAGLQPVIDIYPYVMISAKNNNGKDIKNGKPKTNVYLGLKPGIFEPEPSVAYPLMAARGMYISRTWKDTILRAIKESPLQPSKNYTYSDLGFIILGMAVENIIDMPIENWLDSLFYKPLGAATLTFNPLQKFNVSRIVPTEHDTVFRKQIIQGTVHDPVAAMLGGVAGHAGLFSTANDLGKFMHMLLNDGRYGGEYYIDSSTIHLFTSAPNLSTGNRRGLGFDKPQPDTTKTSPVSRFCSSLSYGHTGFTGTMAWVDPKYNFVFIFLSNRTYPNSTKNKLAELNVRTTLQDIVYQYFINK